MRPRRLVFVTGTGTEVGKTWVATLLLGQLRAAGHVVATRKPAQSFQPGEGPTDAERLAAATGEDPTLVCPPHRSYPLPMAPPMAAMALGRPVPMIADLAGEVAGSWPDDVAIGVVEGAGGVAAPQAGDGDTVDLIAALDPDLVVVVAEGGLGTINLVRLSARALGDWRCVVHLNRYRPDDDLHRRNRAWLADRDGLEVTADLAGLTALVGR